MKSMLWGAVIAACLLIPMIASADVIEVIQVGLVFIPDDVAIHQGDTVRWIWGDGAHTVTSGAGLFDPNMGGDFDFPFDAVNTVVEYTYDGAPGEYPYFCIPHFFLGMTGNVTVLEAEASGTEESTWSQVKALFQ